MFDPIDSFRTRADLCLFRRHCSCLCTRTRVSKVEDLAVYQKALAAADEVSALLIRPEFSRDFDLKDQLGNSSSRVPALISEGFEQKSDRHFAHYLNHAKGSAKESKTQ